MNKLPNIYPGEVLDEEFLKPLHISAYRLAKEMKIPQTRISEILKAKRRITVDTALRLAKFFGTTPQFWLGLQNDYDLEESQKAISEDLIAIHPLAQVTTESHALKPDFQIAIAKNSSLPPAA
jgi:addiction module HigA family antidote